MVPKIENLNKWQQIKPRHYFDAREYFASENLFIGMSRITNYAEIKDPSGTYNWLDDVIQCHISFTTDPHSTYEKSDYTTILILISIWTYEAELQVSKKNLKIKIKYIMLTKIVNYSLIISN